MSDQVFEKSIRLGRPAATVFRWLEQPGVIERLTPPWEQVEMVQRAPNLRPGTRVVLRAKVGPFWTRWEMEHQDYEEEKQFVDVQKAGPFASWKHRHRVEPEGAGSAVHSDRIEYRLPGGWLGQAVAGEFVRRKLERMFAYRHAIAAADLALGARYGTVRRMKIVLAGGTGMVGRALVPFLQSQGHEVVCLVRGTPRAGQVQWDPTKGPLEPAELRGVDVVINLAGENVAGGRWTAARREALWRSRIESTRALVQAMASLKHRPFLLINASAVGVYGDCGDARVGENRAPGHGFLADLCLAWEAEAAKAEELGLRVACLRLGMILTPAGGALAKMLPTARLGLGGPLAGGQQWASWVSVEDVLGAVNHVMLTHLCHGPINVVAPQPVRQGELAAILGKVLRRPAFVPVPGVVLRLLFGEMASVLTESVRAVPTKLEESGYVFRHPTLERALRHLLGRQNVDTAERVDSETGAGGRRTGPRRGRR